MSKIKVYELAKELEKTSKEVVEFLASKNIEVKSHMSSVEETEAELVRKAFGKKEAPKKKSIVQVFRPQNTQSGSRSGRRQGNGRPAQQMGRPMQVNNGRPAKAPVRPEAGSRPVEKVQTKAQTVKPEQVKMQAVKPEQAKVQTEKPEQAKAEAGKAAEAAKLQQMQQEKVSAAQEVKKVQHESQSQPLKNETPQNENGRRTVKNEDRPQGGRRERNDRPQGERRERNDRQGNRSQGERQERNDRQGNRFQGERRERNDRQGNRFQGEKRERNDRQGNRFQGEKRERNDRQGRYRDDNRGQDSNRSHDNNTRRGDRDNRRNSSIPSPIVEGQKPQRSKGKGKDDYKKKDSRYGDKRDEDRIGKGKKNNIPVKQQLTKPQPKEQKQEEKIKSIVIPEVLTIKELADKMKVVPSVIVKKLFMQGKIVTVNQEIDYDTAEEIALEFEVLCEKEEVVDVIEELLKEDEEDESKMKKRPPVVCVMGHVDHGKTSLLDAIRNTNVIDREAGGITQHIGASVVEINGEKITFLDTPGHEAFTAMRMRGANSTDIAVLVVAADDGVMPQTVEAINHAKAAGIEIVVAVNKIDKPSANVERVKQELTEYELIPEDWGGSTIFVPVSAKTGEGLEDLMEMLLLTAEVMELKANPNRRARGLVLEAELDKGRGSVATVLVQKGTLRIGDSIAAGSAHGKVRAMMDDKGRRVKEAGPSMPVEILGLNDVPNAGEVFVGCGNDKEARNFAETFIAQNKVKLLEETKSKLSLDDLFTQIQEGNLKELGIVVKADVQGSVEAVKQSLVKLSNDEVVVKIIHGGVGAINESDVSLASASNAIIIGFNVRPDAAAKETAEREGVDVRLYRVIYNAIEDVEAAMKGMLDPIFEEKVLGHAEVRQTFKASGVGTIAGSYVMDGVFERDCSVRLTRDGIVIFEGPLASLRRFKDDVKEVKAGYECGFVFAGFNDIKEGDLVESFKMVEIPR